MSELYHNDGESDWTDSEYDAIERFARSLDPSHKFFIGVGAAVRGSKVELPYTMGGLEQLFEGDTVKWIANHNLGRERIVASQKYDGTSAMIVYDGNGDLQIAYSRGRGEEGADITRHIKRMRNVPQKVSGAMVVRVEVEVTEKWFYATQEQLRSRSGRVYKNPRNFVAGQMNSSESFDLFYDNVFIIAYEVIKPEMDKVDEFAALKAAGFFTAEHKIFDGADLNDELLSEWLAIQHDNCEFALDGIVLTVSRRDVQAKLTAKKKGSSLKPAYARKFKVGQDDNIAETTVIGVEWNVSKDGLLKPVILVKPVELVGVTVKRASGYNAKYIIESGIDTGARVIITRSGDVIPKIIDILEPASTGGSVPDANEFGDWGWTENKVDIILDDVGSNKTAAVKQLINFFDHIGVEFLGKTSLANLFEAGFTTAESIITASVSDIQAVAGEANGRKGMASIKTKLNPITLGVLAGSHPCYARGVGRRKLTALEKAGVDFLGSATVADIVTVEGFEDKTAEKVLAARDEMNAFLVAIAGFYTVEVKEEVVGGSLEGKYFVFTGVRDKALEAAIEAAGGEVGTSFKKITHLIAKDVNSGSAKATKARDAGAEILSHQQALELV